MGHYPANAVSVGGPKNIDLRGSRGFKSQLHLDPSLGFVSIPSPAKEASFVIFHDWGWHGENGDHMTPKLRSW